MTARISVELLREHVNLACGDCRCGWGWSPSDGHTIYDQWVAHLETLQAERDAAAQTSEVKVSEPDKGNISDGYHTFNELYEHRHSLFSVICAKFGGWKSMFHEDGTMFDGWFIAGVQTPKGMATYHIPNTWWLRFQCPQIERAPHWDGHTPNDVIDRIASLAAQPIAPNPSAAPPRRCPDCWWQLCIGNNHAKTDTDTAGNTATVRYSTGQGCQCP